MEEGSDIVDVEYYEAVEIEGVAIVPEYIPR